MALGAAAAGALLRGERALTRRSCAQRSVPRTAAHCCRAPRVAHGAWTLLLTLLLALVGSAGGSVVADAEVSRTHHDSRPFSLPDPLPDARIYAERHSGCCGNRTGVDCANSSLPPCHRNCTKGAGGLHCNHSWVNWTGNVTWVNGSNVTDYNHSATLLHLRSADFIFEGAVDTDSVRDALTAAPATLVDVWIVTRLTLRDITTDVAAAKDLHEDLMAGAALAFLASRMGVHVHRLTAEEASFTSAGWEIEITVSSFGTHVPDVDAALAVLSDPSTAAALYSEVLKNMLCDRKGDCAQSAVVLAPPTLVLVAASTSAHPQLDPLVPLFQDPFRSVSLGLVFAGFGARPHAHCGMPTRQLCAC